MKGINDRSTWDSYYHCCFNEMPLPTLFVNFSEKTILLQELKRFLISEENIKDNLDHKYKVQSYIKYLGESLPDNSREIVLNDLLNSEDQIIQQLVSYILKGKKLDQSDESFIHNISFFLLLFHDTNSGAFEVLYPEVKKFIETITYEHLFDILGPDLLTIVHELPQNFLSKIAIDVHSISELFKSSYILTNTNSCDILQKRISNQYHFPNQFPFISDEYFTCMNTVITQNKSFMDLLSTLAITDLASFDFENLLQHFNGFQDLIPYFIVANQQLLYSNLDESVQILSSDYFPSSATDLVTRFSNDQKLLEMISFCNGGDLVLTPADLMDTSLVFHLQNVISNTEILEYAEKKYFLVSDDDSAKDFDFIRCYNIFRNFFSIFQSPPTHTKKFLDLISSSFKEIKTNNVRETMVFDLFSLLFLRNKANKFIVSTQVAKAILKLINQFTENKFIKNANSMLNGQFTFWRQDPPFESYLTRDSTNIFRAIEGKNWNLANDLTNGLPYYRNFYVLSCSVDAMINNKTLPDEAVEYKDLINLEVGFSTYSFDLLRSCVKKFSEYKQIIEKRDLNCFDILQNEKWQTINTFMDIFDSLDNFDDFLVTIQNAKNLHHFICDVNFYLKYSNYNGTFDYVKAISNAIKMNKIDDAKQMSLFVGQDLIEIILMNREKFDITKEYILSEYPQNPVLITMIAVSEFGSEISSEISISSVLKKYLDQKLETKTRNDKEMFKELFEKLKANDDNFDDIIYNLDHLKILKEVLCLEIVNDSIIKLLEIVSYQANQGELYQIDTIKIKNFNANNKSLQDKEKTLKFLEKFDKNLTLRYLSDFEFSISKEAFVMLYEKHKDDIAFVKKITNISKSHFELIKSLKEKEKRVNEKLEDKVSKVVKTAFEKLPTEFANCQEKEDILEMIEKDVNLIFKLTKIQKVFFNDEILLVIIRKFTKLHEKVKILIHLSEFFSEKEIFVDFVDKFLTEEICKLDVFDRKAEDDSIKIMKTIRNLAPFSSLHEKFNIIWQILEKRIYLTFGFHYEFKDFCSEKFGNYLENLLVKFDFYDICQNLFSIYKLSETDYLLNICYKKAKMGLIDSLDSTSLKQQTDLNDFELKGWTNSKLLNCFVSPFVHNNEIPTVMTRSLKDLQITKEASNFSKSIYSYVKETVKYDLTNSKPTLFDIKEKSLEKQTMMNKFIFLLSRFCNIDESVSILTSIGNFSSSYQLLHSIEDDDQKKKVFAQSFFYRGLMREKSIDIINFIKKQDPNFYVCSSLFDGLTEFMKEYRLYEGLYFIYSLRNMLEQQAEAALSLFGESETMVSKFNFIGKAYASILMAINIRFHPIELNPPYVPSSASNYELRESLNAVNIMMQFCQFCLSRKINVNSDDIDLVHNPRCAARMAAILSIEEHEKDLYQQIIKSFSVSDRDLESGFCYVVKQKRVEEVFNFLTQMKTKNEDLAIRIMESYLRWLCLTNNFFWIPIFIRIEENPVRRALLFIEYDFLDDANAIIFEHNIDDLSDLLAYRASQIACTMVMLRYRKNE